MVLKPGMERRGRGDLRKWGLDFAIIGKTTDTLRFVVKHQRRGHGRPADQGARRRGAALRPAARADTPQPGDLRADSVAAPMSDRRSAAEARRLARPVLASAGSGSNTTTSSSATPCSARAATPPSCASRTARRASPSPPT